MTARIPEHMTIIQLAVWSHPLQAHNLALQCAICSQPVRPLQAGRQRRRSCQTRDMRVWPHGPASSASWYPRHHGFRLGCSDGHSEALLCSGLTMSDLQLGFDTRRDSQTTSEMAGWRARNAGHSTCKACMQSVHATNRASHTSKHGSQSIRLRLCTRAKLKGFEHSSNVHRIGLKRNMLSLEVGRPWSDKPGIPCTRDFQGRLPHEMGTLRKQSTSISSLIWEAPPSWALLKREHKS